MSAGSGGAGVTGVVVDGGRVWIGCAGVGMQRSDDNGASWQDGGCPSSQISALELDPIDGTLWIATRDLGTLRFSP